MEDLRAWEICWKMLRVREGVWRDGDPGAGKERVGCARVFD